MHKKTLGKCTIRPQGDTTTIRMGESKRIGNTKFDLDMEELELSYIDGRNVKLHKHLGTGWQFLKS